MAMWYIHLCRLENGQPRVVQRFELSVAASPCSIGRHEDCTIRVTAETVGISADYAKQISARHVELLVEDEEKLWMIDHSLNHTFWNGSMLPMGTQVSLRAADWFYLVHRKELMFGCSHSPDLTGNTVVFEDDRQIVIDKVEGKIVNIAQSISQEVKSTTLTVASSDKFGLGSGGMGRVELWQDKTNHICKAVKIPTLSPLKTERDKQIEKFQREAFRHAGLCHRHIVTCFGYTLDPPQLEMEFINGPNLRVHILEHRPDIALEQITLEQIARWMMAIAEAVSYIHLHRLAHCDIKPNNILVDLRDHSVKLTDFGIAHEENATQHSTVLGTREYLAPELYQARSKKEQIPDATYCHADAYALGMTLYFCLTGGTLFDKMLEATFWQILAKSTWEEVLTLANAGLNQAGVDPLLQQICLDQIHFDVKKRTTLEQLRERLKFWLVVQQTRPDCWKEEKFATLARLRKTVLSSRDLSLNLLDDEKLCEAS
jgi:hypothetical protein